jgi:hypothetical protein
LKLKIFPIEVARERGLVLRYRRARSAPPGACVEADENDEENEYQVEPRKHYVKDPSTLRD